MIRTVLATAGAGVLALAALGQGVPGDPCLPPNSRFRVEIEGLPEASASVIDVVMEDLVIDERETTTGADWDYRLYGPGDAHYGSITIRARVGKNSKELLQWWQDCSKGQNIRKSISVICLKRDGSEARRYNLFECFPTRWDPGEYSPSSRVSCETITCKMGRVELALTDPGDGDPEVGPRPRLVEDLADARLPPCAVDRLEVSLVAEGVTETLDGHFADSRGGALVTELVADPATGAEVGHLYVDTLVLRGPLTAGRKALCQWITETVSGREWKRTVVVKEILKDGSAGKTFTYHDCFPTRYVFPRASAEGTGNLYEEVHIKPIRLELAQ